MGLHQLAERAVSQAREFDAAQALARVDHDRALLCEVIGAFLETIGHDLDELDAVLATSDAQGARRVAHRIKGGFGTIGAAGLAEQAFQLERSTQASADEMKRAARELRARTRALDTELRRFLAG